MIGLKSTLNVRVFTALSHISILRTLGYRQLWGCPHRVRQCPKAESQQWLGRRR